MAMYDIFLSYAREDLDVTRQLAGLLEARGWSVWWDAHIPIGSAFDREIEKALHQSRCVVVLWSSRSVDMRYVRLEARFALGREILLPVRIEPGVTLPLEFSDLQTAELLDWNGDYASAPVLSLVRHLEARLGSPATKGPAPRLVKRRLGPEIDPEGIVEYPWLQLPSGQRVVVVGGGDSAIETASEVAPAASKVFLVHRLDSFVRVTSANQSRVDHLIAQGDVEFIPNSIVQSIRQTPKLETEVTLMTANGPRTIICDRVIAQLGTVHVQE